ncbi:LPXTG cell wall anchor domain-containing protein [Streptomyces sp. YIM 98790]|uniref:LPXTG cell wall anchor domain-containing protein n=1 Tax=Streptomyces sp. YIM 98790 TaxID=2689077 RepID=UPI001408023E|nr:LPXTG cell wall anchor domain-containing protein [Streptomyces sp. YIM 98790]
MRNMTLKGAFAASAAAALLAVGAAPAFATGWYEATLRQDTPINAIDFQPEDQEDVCGDVPLDQDGWHFVTEGQDKFKKLTVEFLNGGEQVIEFDPYSKHAYVASAPGDVLVGATAKIKGDSRSKKFNLSHTCPADQEDTSGGNSGGDTTEGTSGDTTEGTSGDTTEGTSGDTTEGTSGDTTEGTSGDTTEGTTGDTTEGTTEGVAGGDETEGQAGGDDTEGVAGGAEPDGDGENLAETGSSAPVVAISVAAAALLGAGGYLVIRRRNAGGNAAA